MRGKTFGRVASGRRGETLVSAGNSKICEETHHVAAQLSPARPPIQVKPGGLSPPQTNLIRVGVGWQCASSIGSKTHRCGHAWAVGSLLRRGNKYSVFK